MSYPIRVWATGFNITGKYSETVDLVNDIGFDELDAEVVLKHIQAGTAVDQGCEALIREYVFDRSRIDWGFCGVNEVPE